jgi:leukotriene-A4 hydrolase
MRPPLLCFLVWWCAGFISCTTSKPPSNISFTMLPKDAHSYAQPNEARVAHLVWNARVDFDRKKIIASAEYSLAFQGDVNEVVLDTKNLTIQEVEVDGKSVDFSLGASDSLLGAPLRIPISNNCTRVKIDYETGDDAEALLWVDGHRPFLFTQSQAILARSWIPCQDSPGVRFTYEATVQVPPMCMALMSADNPQSKTTDGLYHFTMNQPIPSYLLALAVGDVAFKPLDQRTGVYATPDMLDRAWTEFGDMPQMVNKAEELYGPYVWGRYDVLVLPGAFPFGGMENPKLTFATPTVLAGDKSLVSLIAHELAHSWSGNLVTNATWNDFWLNEGFTVYFEQRIMEAVYGREFSEMLAQLNYQDLMQTLDDIESSSHPSDAALKLALDARNPDDGMTDIAYNKGYFMLRLLEEFKGREAFDTFVKNYFTTYAFQVMDTERFVGYLKTHLLTDKEYNELMLDQWIYSPVRPANMPSVNSDRMANADRIRMQWENAEVATEALPWTSWSYQEKYRFLSNLSPEVEWKQLEALDLKWHLTMEGNNEVLFAWLKQAIQHNYTPAFDRLRTFLHEVGRRKFVAPLFECMVVNGKKEMATAIYNTSRAGYHSVTQKTVDGILSQ